MRARLWTTAAVLATAALTQSGAVGQVGYQPSEESIEALPAGAGREETFYTCTPCHGTALIRAQGMNAERWNATVQLMIDQHKMNPPDDADRRKIVAYLAMTYPPRAQPGGFTNPFLKR